MVKGNWERRAELAAQRRDEDKRLRAERKERVAGGGTVSAESVVTRLRQQQHAQGQDEGMLCWLSSSSPLPSPAVCRAMYRTGFCSTRKCRLVHPASPSPISRLRGVICFEEAEAAEVEEEVDPTPVDLFDLSSKQLCRLRFVSIGGLCVYDYAENCVWVRYCQELSSLTHKISRLAIQEEKEGDGAGEAGGKRGGEEEASGKDKYGDEKEACDDAAGGGVGDDARLTLNGTILQNKLNALKILPLILSFLTVRDIFCGFAVVSCRTRSGVLGDAASRLRKKTAFGQVSGLLSKKARAENKKSKKKAHIGQKDKIDAFARGIPR